MQSRFFALAFPAVVLATTVPGCHPDLRFPRMMDVKRINAETLARDDAHDKNMTHQHKLMSPEVADKLDALRTEFQARIELERKKTEEQQAETDRLLAEEAKKIVQLITRNAGLPDFVTNLVSEMFMPEVRRTGAALNDVQQALAVLSQQTQDKLGKLSPEAVADLATLRSDANAFRQRLQEVANLTDRQIEELEGLSPDEIMAMIAAAAAAAAAGGALGKTGKSRSHGEVEKLKESVMRLLVEAAGKKSP